MKIEIEFDEEKLIREVMENYPEASTPSLQCVDYDYKKCLFKFLDHEEQNHGMSRVYEDIGMVELKKGMKILLDLLSKDKLPGLCINLNNFQDAGEWDSDCCDALVQCGLFGEVIYG